MKIKKFNFLPIFLLSKNFREKDLTGCDLSGLDLSKLPASTWKNFVFYHTNFKDTQIKFYPKDLYSIPMGDVQTYLLDYCDFTNCDLSYLTTEDLAFTSISGSNFTNTNLDVELFTGFGKDIKHVNDGLWYKDYSDVVFPQNDNMVDTINKISSLIDYQTVKNNPHIPFSSATIFSTIKKALTDRYTIAPENQLTFIDEMIEEDSKRNGRINEFFSIFVDSCSLSDSDKILFFKGKVEGMNFSKIDLSNIPFDLINEIKFYNCKFEKIVFPNNIEKDNKKLTIADSLTPNVYFPTIDVDSWKKFDSTRLFASRITFHRNLYLELGRFCNGKCKFCRNQYLEPCIYDLEAIKNNLLQIGNYLNSIVIGGGEPTLALKDIKYLRDASYNEKFYDATEWIIFTNGSYNLDELIDFCYGYYGYSLKISRHSVSDDDNNRILGVKATNASELIRLYNAGIYATLCPTCFKGGIDSVSKIEEYMKFADECRIFKIMFQTLHKDLTGYEQVGEVLSIEDEIFDEMIIKLEEQGYKIGIPIYSTGDYKLIIAKKGDKTLSFKKYITKEELEKEWYQACKRTFDLSMDPSGNVYQNWHQSSGKVLLKSQVDR